jgi:hypothetical protein
MWMRDSGRHTSSATADDPAPSFSGPSAAEQETSAPPEGPPPSKADPWAAVACAPRAAIPHSQAPIRRAKTEVITESLRPVWSACPFTMRQAKHGAMKRR